MRIAVGKTLEPHAFEPVKARLTRLIFRDAAKLQAHHDVVNRCRPRHQAFGLKHVAGPMVDAVQGFAVNQDAPGSGL